MLVMMESATGVSIDAPRACSARKAIRPRMPGARLHNSDPSVNRAMPI